MIVLSLLDISYQLDTFVRKLFAGAVPGRVGEHVHGLSARQLPGHALPDDVQTVPRRENNHLDGSR